MPIFTDNLDGSVGDLLRNRSGWSRPVGADEAQIISGFTGGFALTLGTTVASSTWHVPTTQPSSADQYVSGLLDTAPQASVFPLGIRCDVSNNLGAGYLVRHGTTGVLQLFRRTNAGAQAQIGSASVTVGDLATNPVTLKAVGNQISVEFMGATVIGPVTDTTSASGSVAVLSRGGAPSTRSMLNSWQSGEVGSSPSPISGAATGSVGTITGSAAASQPISATSGGSVGIITGSASGVLALTASALGSIGMVTGGGVGDLPIGGAASGSVGTVLGSATGVLAITANSLGVVGTITGGGAAQLSVAGTAAGNVGTIGGTATAVLPILSVAEGSIGLIAGAAAGGTGTVLPIESSAAGSIGAIGGSAIAMLSIHGEAVSSIGIIGGSAQARVGLHTPLVWLTIAAEDIDLTIDVEPLNLTITASENGARDVKTLPNKTPDAVYRVTLNMPAWITPENPVVDIQMIPHRGDVVIADAQVLTASRAEFWLSGGTAGKLNTFTALAHLADGQKYPQSVRVMVRETI